MIEGSEAVMRDDITKLIDIYAQEVTKTNELAGELAVVARDLKRAGQDGLAATISYNSRHLRIRALDLSGKRAALREREG